MIDEAYQESYQEKIKSEDKIIYNQDLSFLKQEDSGRYRSVMADDYIDMKEAEVKTQYQKRMRQVREEAKAVNASPDQPDIARLSNTGGAQPLAQVVYKNQHLAGVSWNDSTNNFNFVPYEMGEFRNDNHCGPTAATNLVYYWSLIRPGGHRPLFLGPENALRPEKAVFGMLHSGMRSEYTGTDNKEIIPGIRAFARSRYDDIAGSGSQTEGAFSSVNWSFITNQINQSIPLIVLLNGDPKYKNHFILCVGYQECSDGNYLRMADGHSKSISNFYYFKGSIVGAYYVRW